jgi:cysteinyl-tRNA synthetase
MDLSREDVEAKILTRTEARANQDWAASDTIRDELDAAGVMMMDGSEGTTWRLRICD